ncbi:MAG: hypothetical protein IPP74_09430 [Alphaproteobacteria bacterium]|nr:hypothetical protein [Alphaproteobacteria bacterium]
MRCFNHLIRAFIIALGCIALSACIADVRPMARIFTHMPENAPIEYQLGWKQGCESGISAMGNDFFKTFYHYTQSAELVHNEVYYKAWKDSFTYCRNYTYGMTREFSVRYRLPHDDIQIIPNADQTAPWGSPILSGNIQGLNGIYPTAPDDAVFGNLRDPFFKALGP